MIHVVTSRQGRNAVDTVRRQREEALRVPYISRKTSDFVKETPSWDDTTAALEAKRKAALQLLSKK